MIFKHIVSGDAAEAGVSALLPPEDRDILNMDDDLSLGPLADVDAVVPHHRAVFWRKVLGPQAMEIEARGGDSVDVRLARASASFRRLAEVDRPCLVWCGGGPNEQLALRRAAHFLRSSGQPLWIAEAPARDDGTSSIGALDADALAAAFERRREMALPDRAALARDWFALCGEGAAATLRQVVPAPGTGDRVTRIRFITCPLTQHDPLIQAEATPDWEPSADVVGRAMLRLRENLATDVFVYWRLRELARRGWLEIELPEAGMEASRIRLRPPS